MHTLCNCICIQDEFPQTNQVKVYSIFDIVDEIDGSVIRGIILKKRTHIRMRYCCNLSDRAWCPFLSPDDISFYSNETTEIMWSEIPTNQCVNQLNTHFTRMISGWLRINRISEYQHILLTHFPYNKHFHAVNVNLSTGMCVNNY